MIPFKVLWLEYNKNKPTYYDIMPYLVRKYNDAYKADKPSKENFEQCKMNIDIITRVFMKNIQKL